MTLAVKGIQYGPLHFKVLLADGVGEQLDAVVIHHDLGERRRGEGSC